jgi:hypothetical protein
MSKNIAKVALAAVMAVSTIVPSAMAGPRHHGAYSHHAYNGYRGGHRGRGHWHNGKWIALGIVGAAVGAAIADSQSRHCWYEYGRRYCD